MSGFQVSALTRSVFLSFCVSLSVGGWLLAAIGQGIADQRNEYTWWCLVYLLLLIVGMAVVVMTGSLRQYRLALLAFSVIGLIYSTQGIGAWYLERGANKVAGIGYFFMTLVCYLWVIALGSESDSAVSRNLAAIGYQTPEAGAMMTTTNQQPMTSVTTTAPHNHQGQTLHPGPPAAVTAGATAPSTSIPAVTGNPSATGPQDVQYLYRAQALYACT